MRYGTGEIDLVMRERDVVVSVEVRYRRNAAFGGAAASIDARKQRRWIRATLAYLAAHPELADCCVRFDVLAIDGARETSARITWLRDVVRPDAD